MAFRKEGGSYSKVTFGRKVKKLDGGASAKSLAFMDPSPKGRYCGSTQPGKARYCDSSTPAMLAIGLDVGTQSTKCIVYDVDSSQIVGRSAAAYGLISHRHGQAEQDPSIWIEACKSAIEKALQTCDPTRVRGIGVSGQQHGLVVLDNLGSVIRPAKLWCDLESASEARELSSMFGTSLVPSFTITKVLWLKRHEPDNYARIAHILLPHDYINYWLTGKCTMEASDASGTGFFNPTLRNWDEHRLDAIDPALKSWLPSAVLGPNDIAGHLQVSVAEELGLPPDAVVAPGGGDNAMSALGAGVVEEGVWILSLGTSGTLFGPAKQEIEDASGAICAFCDATGQALPLLCTVNCTGILEEVRKMFGMSHDELTALAALEKPGCEGLTMLPYLAGERTPDWPHASGAILGLRAGLLRPGLLYRAAIEGVTFSLLRGMRSLQMQSISTEELRVVGGGSQNQVWLQIVADAFQLPIRLPLEVDSAALGAAFQAAAVALSVNVKEFVLSQPLNMAPQVVSPSKEVAGDYATAFQRFINFGDSIYGENGIVQQ